MEQRWRRRLSWQAEEVGRVVAARVEQLDLEVRPPSVIMEIALVVAFQPDGAAVVPPAPGGVTSAVPDTGGAGNASGPHDLGEAATAGAGDPPVEGAPPEGAADEGFAREAAGGPDGEDAGIDGAGGEAGGHAEWVRAAAAPGRGQGRRPHPHPGRHLHQSPAPGRGLRHSWWRRWGKKGRAASLTPCGPEGGPEAPGSCQDAGPPAGTAAGPSQPRPLQELLWEGIREVRQLDAAAAGRSIVAFGGKNIVLGGP